METKHFTYRLSGRHTLKKFEKKKISDIQADRYTNKTIHKWTLRQKHAYTTDKAD